MRERWKFSRFINAGSLCLVAGSGLAVFGAVRTFGFLGIVHTYQRITARELILRLVVPHMLLLSGIGLITAAFILITRAVVIRSRIQHKEI
jgi:hypothetical protein